MRSEHVYTCLGCGKRDTCGDCVLLYCPDCDAKIRTAHNGKLPSFFTTDYENCPCSECISRKNTESINAKLIAYCKELEDKIAILEARSE